MPANNHFRHQQYTADPPATPYELLTPPNPPPIDSDEYRRQLAEFGQRLRDNEVQCVYLVHGTFTGTDALGVLRQIERRLPSLGKSLRQYQKRVVDYFAGEDGNYTTQFAELLQRGISDSGTQQIPVKLFHWSSENNHVGRADGAVKLLLELIKSAVAKNQKRILLWGHSHAGNLFALASNILAADQMHRRWFFDATRSLQRRSRGDASRWRQLRQLLTEHDNPLPNTDIDFVTFGTPIRYGWDSNGYDRLLNFVHHRTSQRVGESTDAVPSHLSPFPPSWESTTMANDGDYIQQIGIAGTNLLPYLFAWRQWVAEARLSRMLQSDIRKRDLLDRLSLGQRVPDEGHTLLVEYPDVQDDEGEIMYQSLLGHGVYTRREFLSFHAREVGNRLYA